MNTILKLLNNLNFPKNRSRHNVMYDKPSDYVNIVNGKVKWVKGLKKWCYSMSFGRHKPMFGRGNGIYKNNIT